MKSLHILLMAVVALPGPIRVGAQEASDTPKLIEIVTEESSPSAGAGLAGVLQRIKAQPTSGCLHWKGGTTITGELNQTTAIFSHKNYGSLQQCSDAIQGAWQSLPAGQRPKLISRVYEFLPAQTYNDGYVKWSDAQAFKFFFVQIVVGGGDEFAQQERLASEYLTKAKVLDEEWLGFQPDYGAGAPYIFVTPLRSIAMLDEAIPHGNPFPPEVDRPRDAALRKLVVSYSSDLFVVKPELSSKAD